MLNYLSFFDDEKTGSLERRDKDLDNTWDCYKKCAFLIWASAVASCTVICLDDITVMKQIIELTLKDKQKNTINENKPKPKFISHQYDTQPV
ncbi:hypothetical protein PIROE2DRAFT_8321 [Piromyces sp. E2]|nr:hypothetical protein PIROE2DRAFT_8321 [Piromyces sp. E2]|eukprot:OUM64784.1 hypothetical protein PIROE2DRAFT_8321 [Piromyces sp. E2]